MKIAVCQYTIELLPNWKAYIQKILTLVLEAKENACQLLILPEYAGIEVATGQYSSDAELYKSIQTRIGLYKDFFQDLAIKYQLYIQPGTIIEAISPNQYRNRAYFFGPSGTIGYQDKLQLTEYEKSDPLLSSGNTQTVFDTEFGKIGIAVCYDSEFPEHIRSLAAAGSWLIIVPSYTTSTAGFYRVYLSCRARAIENQCYLAMASAVGSIDFCGPAEESMGKAAVMGPADIGFPDDGIVTQGIMNRPEMIFSAIFPEKIETVRKIGQVHNFEDSNLLRQYTPSQAKL
jgi:predicted amidohydrolase